MIITILATGSRGDVQPYLALGRGLARAGHTVRFVTTANFAPLASSFGLETWPVDVDVQAIVEDPAMRARVEGGNFLRLMAQMARLAEDGAIRLASQSLPACQGADLLLAGMGGVFTGIAIAEKLGLPLVQAYVVPLTPTAAFPGALTPGLPAWAGPAARRLSHHITRQVLWQSFRSADRRARREVLGLPPAPAAGPFASPALRGMPVLYGISPAVIARPPDWDAETHVTGFWLDGEQPAWTPPPALQAFLDDGPPPVYIGFGSMSNRSPAETTATVLQALRLSGQRGVLATGWGGLGAGDLPATVHMLDSAPHGWLFPRMAAVVHHGGAGTTAAGLQAGVPSLVVPFFGDQPFWGRRVADLGAGPAPIPRRRLSAERLAAAIRQAVEDPAMRRTAARLGEQIRSEDGVARAVELVGRLG